MPNLDQAWLLLLAPKLEAHERAPPRLPHSLPPYCAFTHERASGFKRDKRYLVTVDREIEQHDVVALSQAISMWRVLRRFMVQWGVRCVAS